MSSICVPLPSVALKSFATRDVHLDRFYKHFALQRSHLTRRYVSNEGHTKDRHLHV